MGLIVPSCFLCPVYEGSLCLASFLADESKTQLCNPRHANDSVSSWRFQPPCSRHGNTELLANSLTACSHRRHGQDKTRQSCLVRVGGVNKAACRTWHKGDIFSRGSQFIRSIKYSLEVDSISNLIPFFGRIVQHYSAPSADSLPLWETTNKHNDLPDRPPTAPVSYTHLTLPTNREV